MCACPAARLCSEYEGANATDWVVSLALQDIIGDLLQQYSVDLVVAGHYHVGGSGVSAACTPGACGHWQPAGWSGTLTGCGFVGRGVLPVFVTLGTPVEAGIVLLAASFCSCQTGFGGHRE